MKLSLRKILKALAWPLGWVLFSSVDPAACLMARAACLFRSRRLADWAYRAKLGWREKFETLVVRLCEQRLRVYAGQVVSFCENRGCFLPSTAQDQIYGWLVTSISGDAAMASEMAALAVLPARAGALSARIKAFDRHVGPHVHAACCAFGEIPLVVEEVSEWR